MTAATKVSGMIKGGPNGTRLVVDASSGTVEGPRLNGTIVGPGGDWVLLGADGAMTLDVRILIKTADGDVYMTYHGFGVNGDITTAPRFEASGEANSWLNTSVCVAKGELIDGGVKYNVFRVG